MHISEGVLSAGVLVTGIGFAAAGTAVGLKKLSEDKIPQAAILSAAFFVASLIHVPIGPSSVHLILNGILGLLLGWAAVPAILIALLLQGVLFQFGGITTLGINTVVMAGPAVICHYLFRAFIQRDGMMSSAAAFVCGALSVFLSSVFLATALMFSEGEFLAVASAVVAAHLPVMVVEGLITGFCVGFLKKVRPELLPGWERGRGAAVLDHR